MVGRLVSTNTVRQFVIETESLAYILYDNICAAIFLSKNTNTEPKHILFSQIATLLA
jgi:hypothetical protein